MHVRVGTDTKNYHSVKINRIANVICIEIHATEAATADDLRKNLKIFLKEIGGLAIRKSIQNMILPFNLNLNKRYVNNLFHPIHSPCYFNMTIFAKHFQVQKPAFP